MTSRNAFLALAVVIVLIVAHTILRGPADQGIFSSATVPVEEGELWRLNFR